MDVIQLGGDDVSQSDGILSKGGDQGEALFDVDNSTAAFEALERDFQEVLGELVGDKNLEKFRIEYEKLHRALKKSHEQEKRLIKKCRELNTEIVNNAAKVQTALKLSQEDQSTNANLRKEIEKAWAMVDVAQDKENKAKETINALKDEIQNLSKLVEKGAGLSIGQENMVKELVKVRDDLQRENDEKSERITILESQMDALLKAKDEVDQSLEEAHENQATLQQTLSKRDQEMEREQRRRERLEKEFKEISIKFNQKLVEQVETSRQMGQAKMHVHHLEQQLNEARATMEKYLRDYESLYSRTQKLSGDLEDQVARNNLLLKERNELEKAMKIKHADVARIASEMLQMEKKFEREHKQVLKYKQVAEDAKTPLLVAQGEIDVLNKELELFRRQELKTKKVVETLALQKEQERKAHQRAEELVFKKDEVIEDGKRIATSLQSDLLLYRVDLANLKKTIHQLERERTNLQAEISEQRRENHHVIEDVKTRDVKIHELQRKIIEVETRFKQQQQLYESVRSDRNNYSKSLIEAQDEIAEMRREAKIMNHQIEQLKEEIAAKDQALVREHFDFKDVEKQREQLRAELSKLQQLLSGDERLIKQQDVEMQRLTLLLKRMDEEALTQRKEYDQVVNERDILGTQLIRRNDELALLYEKIRIMQSTLEKGEVQYNNRLKDIRVLRLKCLDLERDLANTKHTGNTADEHKREVFRLQREVLQEKTKVKALSEELENPMNIHRWRKLEGSDPATYEMIQKIQTLQKRLISKTEEVVERDQIISEKEKLYLELKKILARQPGPEVAEQLSVYQVNLKEKNQHMKALAAELNMYRAQVNEYRYEIERLTRELQELKRRYYEQKRREQLTKEVAQEATVVRGGKSSMMEQQINNAKAATTRFTGGGFAIK